MMSLTNITLALVVAFLSVLASTFLNGNNINPSPTIIPTFITGYFATDHIAPVFRSIISSPNYIHCSHHHKRQKPSEKKTKVSVCDDFPPDFTPPDTNTTSYFCVDRNGCCNFTTVQSAVDAVANFSLKRNVILINSGIYL